jgi:hypothetical protein
MQFVRQIGCALIVALLGALVTGGDASLNIGGAALASGRAGPEAFKGLGASFSLVFIAIAICVGLSLLFLLRMEEKPLRGAPS